MIPRLAKSWPRAGDRFLSSVGTGRTCDLSLWGCQTPAQYWIKILHPKVQKFYPVLGLGSGRRLLGHFQTPVLNWMIGDLKISSTSTERQKRSQNLAPVLVIISGNSLVFSRRIITSIGFYLCCAHGASAPVVVKKSVSQMNFSLQKSWIWVANVWHKHFRVEIAAVFLAVVLWQHPRSV